MQQISHIFTESFYENSQWKHTAHMDQITNSKVSEWT